MWFPLDCHLVIAIRPLTMAEDNPLSLESLGARTSRRVAGDAGQATHKHCVHATGVAVDLHR